jgi:hypothetical protein
MKQYVVDELRPDDYDRLKAYLGKNLDFAGFDGLYWKTIDEALLTSVQASHTHCKPLCFALTLTPESLTCELLVRTGNSIRCDCMGYATTAQRNWIVEWTDNVFEELGIIV